MDIFSNSFEKKWALIFGFLFFIIMVPFPFFYAIRYIPVIYGLPSFIVGWTAHTAITMVLIVVFYVQAMRRPEYHEFDEERKGE
ncbi:MAG: hypothetical protein SOY64_00830 [Pyramidobacter sp.]|uniref:hypothetical protein n=1 Tax=Pyramidobacter sp. TaxID=1943581 RepID=UPI002A80B42D|nr:hypothetical protein [Pyramidobacter sp.]MDY4031597.1 hypothetical protein [Pyramidobacter sp.]